MLSRLSVTLNRWFRPPLLTRRRVIAAFAIAVITDGLQWLLGPLGWAFFDEGLDLFAMVIITKLIGFHYLLLPTFVIEAIPVLDLVPGWTACTAAVVALRKRSQKAPPIQVN